MSLGREEKENLPTNINSSRTPQRNGVERYEWLSLK